MRCRKHPDALAAVAKTALYLYDDEVHVSIVSDSVRITQREHKWILQTSLDREGKVRQAWVKRGSKQTEKIPIGDFWKTLETIGQEE